MNGDKPSKGLKVLEFFGVPGVGKSYLMRNGVPADIETPMVWYSQGGRAQRIRRKVSLMLRHLPAAFATAVWARKMIGLFPSMGWCRRWKVLFNWVFVDCLIREAARARNAVLVLDQGIAQALWSTQFGARGEGGIEEVHILLRRYLERLPISEWAVVRVTASQEIVRKRVEEREGFSPVDRDSSLMDEAYCTEQEVGQVLNALDRGANGGPKIAILSLVNVSEAARCRAFVRRWIGLGCTCMCCNEYCRL